MSQADKIQSIPKFLIFSVHTFLRPIVISYRFRFSHVFSELEPRHFSKTHFLPNFTEGADDSGADCSPQNSPVGANY